MKKMSPQKPLNSQRNYKITFPSSILVKNKIWYRTTNKSSYLVLYKPYLYDNNYTESTLNIYNMKSRTTLKTLKFMPSRDNIRFILHLPNTNTLILWSIETTSLFSLSLWDLNTNLRTKFANFNDSTPLSLELNPLKSNQFITCSHNFTRNLIQVKTWNSSTFECIQTLQFQTNGRIECARVNHFAQTLITILYEPLGHLKIWNLSSTSFSKATTIRFESDLDWLRCRNNILVRSEFKQNQFVTSHSKVKTKLLQGSECIITMRMWSDDNEKIISCESFDTRSLVELFLFALSVNEFACINPLSGTITVWCWNESVFLRSFNTNLQHISSCVCDITSQKLIFTRNRIDVVHLVSEHRYSQLAVFDLGLGKLVETFNEHDIVEYGMTCWSVMADYKSVESSCIFI